MVSPAASVPASASVPGSAKLSSAPTTVSVGTLDAVDAGTPAPTADSLPLPDELGATAGKSVLASFDLYPRVSNPAIKELTTLCVEQITANLEAFDDLKPIPECHVKVILATAPLTLPLVCAVQLLADGVYWKRKMRAQYPNEPHDPARKEWKQLYLETYASKLLEAATPATMESAFAEIALFSPYVERLSMRASPHKYPFPRLFRTCRSLKSLTLRAGCGRGAIETFAEFEALDLKDPRDRVDNKDAAEISQALGSLGHQAPLEELDMTDNSLTDGAFLRIAKGVFFGFRCLRRLVFSHNLIRDEGAKAIASLLIVCPMEELDLSDNQIGADGATRVAECAAKCAKLQSILLAANRIGDAGAEAFGVLLGESRSRLERLDLSGNGIVTAVKIAGALSVNTYLRELVLAGNPLSDESQSALQEAAGASRSLDRIDMRVYPHTDADFEISTAETSEAPLLRFK